MDLLHPDDREGMRRAAQAYLSGATGDYEAEYRVRHRDGSYRWVLARGKAVRDACNGQLQPAVVPIGRSQLWTHPTLAEYVCHRMKSGVK